ncbi:MAG TPA: alpha/beta fold hydrolase [Chitinophagaceae bacterium]
MDYPGGNWPGAERADEFLYGEIEIVLNKCQLRLTIKSESPAWKQKPSWFIVAKNDKAINPELERFMAKRIKAKTIEIASSHVVMVSHPKEVLSVIEAAAGGKK